MTIYQVYEDFTNLMGKKEHKRIGTVEAKTLKSAVNKAKKQFRRDEWGRSYSEGRRVVYGIDGNERF